MKTTLMWCLMALLSLMVAAQTQDKKMDSGTRKVVWALPPVYAFEGAEAQYKISYASTSSTAKMTVNVEKINHRSWCNVAIRYTGQLAPLSRDGRLLCDNSNQPFWADPTTLSRFKEWHKGNAAGPPWGASEIRHSAAVSVPAGNFLTEELYQQETAGYYESGSGLLVKLEGNVFKGSDQLVPELKGVNKVTIVLTQTNIPMTVAPIGK